MEDSKRIEEFYEEKMFCHHCDDSLAGHRYVLRDDHPYCIKCYENVFANNCDECGKIIGIDSKVSVYLVGVFFGDIFLKMSSGCVFSPGHTYRIGNRVIVVYPILTHTLLILLKTEIVHSLKKV